MDSEQLSSQTVSAYNANSFICVEYGRRKQPADNTCWPINEPVPDRGYSPKLLSLPVRSLEVTALPQEPLFIFQQFLPTFFAESWARYTNSWVNHLLEEVENGSCTVKPQSWLLQWRPTSVVEIYRLRS